MPRPTGSTLLVALAEAGRRATPGVTVSCSGGPSAAEVHDEVRALERARNAEVYGSTETACIGWRVDPRATFRLFDRWRRRDGDRIARASDADAASVVLPDHVTFDDDRYLRPIGRRDHAVTVGGVTVHPTAVAAIIADQANDTPNGRTWTPVKWLAKISKSALVVCPQWVVSSRVTAPLDPPTDLFGEDGRACVSTAIAAMSPASTKAYTPSLVGTTIAPPTVGRCPSAKFCITQAGRRTEWMNAPRSARSRSTVRMSTSGAPDRCRTC